MTFKDINVVAFQFVLQTERIVTVVTPPSYIIQYYMQQAWPLRVVWIWEHSTVLCPSAMLRRKWTVCSLQVTPSNNKKRLWSHKSVHTGKKYFGLIMEGKKKSKSWKLKFLCKCTCVLTQTFQANFHKILYFRLNKVTRRWAKFSLVLIM
jgi:hypothetical protein